MSGFSETESWRFRPDIEGLRAVAIIGVILFHAGIAPVSGGFLGVDVFFVLSGFLITGILIEEVRKTGTLSLPAFWARRARRLLPAATLVSVVTLLFLVSLDSPFAERRYVGSAISFATYWSNLLFWRRGVNYFDQSVAADPFLHTWSLAVEEQYYLLFAPCVLLLALAVRKRGAGLFQRRLRTIAIVASLVSLLAYLVLTRDRPVFAFYGIPTRAWEFGVGTILALAASRPAPVHPRLAEALAVVALIAVVLAWFITNERTPASGFVTLLPVLGTATLIQLGSRGTVLIGGLLQAAPMRWLGRLSYSWYLWHWPITVYWTKLAPGNPIPLAVGMPLLSLGLAQLTYSTIEHPARQVRWLQSAQRGLLAALILALTTSVVALGVRRRAALRLSGTDYAYILEARDARTRLHEDGCDREQGAATLEKCSYGVRNATTTVVLFGDSHAAQWFAAFEPLARSHGWRLITLSRPGCPSLFVTVWTQMDRSPGFCERWREISLQQIRQLQPALIVITNSRSHALLDGGSSPQPAVARPDLWQRGLERSLAALPPRSAILLLEDSPAPRFDVPSCLVEHVHEVQRCSFARDSALVPGISKVERGLGRADARVHYADLTDAICAADRCPAARDHLA
ncbi:MAG TPA: acyltransferase family protein, partial [Gemmatimonadales bacterium]|nr:acyltransferase family protein [Gemmatimonadales bacterium]